MQSQKKARTHLRVLLLMGILIAFSILFGKYLAFNMGEMIRISFENLSILLAGIFLGPLCGMTVGVAADLLGCLLVGYAINPIVTAGAAAIGLFAGISAYLFRRSPLSLRVVLIVLISHLIGSVGIKTAGLAAFYGTSYPILALWRMLNYLLVGTAEGVLLFILLKSAVKDALLHLIGRTAEKERAK